MRLYDEDDENRCPVRYNFRMQDVNQDFDFGTRDIESSLTIGGDAQWDLILTNFLDFLGSVYGYDLKQQVFYKGNPNFTPAETTTVNFDDPWPFDMDDEDEEEVKVGGSA